MPIQHIPLLELERELHDVPRGMERFREYLRVVVGDNDLGLMPLSVMNPMGREHVAARLDELLACDAEAIAVAAIADAARRLTVAADYRHGLVVVDDLRGGWTNRYTTEASLFFEGANTAKRGWITTALWVSEPAEPATIRRAVLASIFRTDHAARHGWPGTLGQMLVQEGRAAAFAGQMNWLDQEELAYCREVIEPHLESTTWPICMAAMYGDGAASNLGYAQLGLPERAGFAVALAAAGG